MLSSGVQVLDVPVRRQRFNRGHLLVPAWVKRSERSLRRYEELPGEGFLHTVAASAGGQLPSNRPTIAGNRREDEMHDASAGDVNGELYWPVHRTAINI